MTCTECGAEAPDGSSFCPACDAVLDPGAFEEQGAEEQAAPPPSKAPPRVADPRRAPKPAAVEAPAPRRRRKAPPSVDYSPDRVLADTWGSLQLLSPFDRLAVGGFAVSTLSLLLPWKFTQVGGDEIGVFAGGWLVFLCLGLAAAALWFRTGDDLRGIRPDHLALAQLLGAVSSVGLSAYLFFSSLDPHPYKSLLGTTNLWSSYPEFGVVVCALSGLVLAYASIWAWWAERETMGG